MKRKDNLWEIKREYFLWLSSLIKADKPRHDCLEFVWSLHQKEFYWSVPNDDNRAEDGKKLREAYFRETSKNDCDCLDGPCSILEMIIGLAYRIDYILTDSEKGIRIEKWFWELINNLGLEQFSDNDPYIQEKIARNDKILTRMLNRDYSRNGDGGLFPLKMLSDDQKKIELWYQMMSYLDENYTD